jgi:hypothetical protein
LIAKLHRLFSNKRSPNDIALFSNKILQNCCRLFSDQALPKDVAYSAIKERQIVIAYLVIKIAPN